jgi:putative mRNA 3-end processing factor
VAAPSILAGAVVLAPPSFLLDAGAVPWPDPVTSFASGWVGVRRLARQRGGELPLIVSDHADWSELTQTLDDVGAPEVWITHGEEAALIHHARTRGIAAEALSVVGYGEEGH